MFFARTNGGGGAARTQVDGCQVVAHLTAAVAKIARAAGSELAEPAPAPTFDVAVVQQCTRVLVTCADGGGGAARTKVDSRKVVAHLASAVAKAGGISLTKPSVVA